MLWPAVCKADLVIRTAVVRDSRFQREMERKKGGVRLLANHIIV